MQAELLETGALARSIEAVLFVAAESLSIKTLAKLTGAEEADVSVALQTIDADYASRGIVLREVAGGYRFATAPDARAVVEKYLMPPKTTLSPAALETLAIVAYMQPVTKSDIEGIRGVNADSVLSTLVDRRFLTEAGRKDVAGRPILYKTTSDFLEAFGLRSLEELPPIDIDADAPIELAFPIATQSTTPPVGPDEAGQAALPDEAGQAALPDEAGQAALPDDAGEILRDGAADPPEAVAAADIGVGAPETVNESHRSAGKAGESSGRENHAEHPAGLGMARTAATTESEVVTDAATDAGTAGQTASLGGLGGEISGYPGGRDEASRGDVASGAMAARAEAGAGPAACDESENVLVS